MRARTRLLGLAAGILFLTIAGAPTPSRSAEVDTRNGRVPAKEVSPPSGRDEPSDIGKKAHTPLRVIVPDKPVEPPVPGRNTGGSKN